MRYVFNPITNELDLVQVSLGGSQSITVSLSKSVANMLEFTALEIPNILTWKVLRNGAAINPASVILSKTEGADISEIATISNPTSNTGTQSAPLSYLGKTTFKAKFTVAGQNFEATTSATTVLPIFIGFGNIEDDLETLISQESFEKHVVSSFDKKDFNMIVPSQSCRLIIIIPEDKHLVSITSDGGFIVPIPNMSNPRIENRILNGNAYPYKIYYSNFIMDDVMSFKLTIN